MLQMDNPFWQFSKHYWQNADAQKTLLGLQNSAGYCVTLLLFACWLGRNSRPIEPVLQASVTTCRSFDEEVLQRLRCIRNYLKHQNDYQSLRNECLALELHAEQQLQAQLFHMTRFLPENTGTHAGSPLYCITENLFACSALASTKHIKLESREMALLISATLPALDAQTVYSHLEDNPDRPGN